MQVDLSWFDPSDIPAQLKFLRCLDKESAYIGGFGAGKTLAGGFKALLASLEHPGTVGLVGRQSYQALEQTTKKVLLDGDDKPPIIPPELIKERLDGTAKSKVELTNGSEILFRSYQDWNPEKIRSLNLGWLWLDEASEASEKIWAELVGRLRHPAGPMRAWITSNPNGHDWMWRRFHPDSGQAIGPLFVARTDENLHLAADYVTHLRLTMPAEWQKRFLDASFDTAAGQIWDEWDRTVHVLPAFEVPYQWRRFESLDHGRRNPTSVLWFAVDEDANLLVENGYQQPGPVEQHAAAIIMARGARKYPPVTAAPDAFNLGNTGQRVSDIYLEHGVQMVRANDNVAAGLLRVSEVIHRQPDVAFPDWHPYAGTLGPDGRGAPRLFVLDVPGTLDLRREIPDYRYRDLSPATERNQDQPEEPRKKDDHACDALRYGVMTQPRPTPVPAEAEVVFAPAVMVGMVDKVF